MECRSESGRFDLPPPRLHRSHMRCVIEPWGGWKILGYDRRRPEYASLYMQSRTPLQLLGSHPAAGALSLITPCRQTDGKFELWVAGLTQRFCCYCCAGKRVEAALDVMLPPWQVWMPYLLLESAGYQWDPRAPRERGLAG
ncbi:MAG: hypothetical protein M5U26_28375 [Planctomycetota bacterium]|nr:hypothetical protein [Planctomycetota bacterium]